MDHLPSASSQSGGVKDVRGNSEPPVEVVRNLTFFEQNGLWHIVSKNPPARSCAEAARVRRRLGYIGIPLSDELKSTAGAYDSPAGRRYAVVHCRGHQRLDSEKVRAILGSEFRRLGAPELESELGASYGTVTPFALAHRKDIRQVADETLFANFFSPYTMMTNLGHLQYAVEFPARDVFNTLPDVAVADVVLESDHRVPVEHTIGILTGNSPEAGILLWSTINNRIRAHEPRTFRGDTGFPRVIVDSVPGMGLSMEIVHREAHVRPIVIDGVRRLCESGANLIALACNTTQYFAPEIESICADYGARFVSIVDETARVLERKGIRRFDFLAISPVVDFQDWSDFSRIANRFEIHVPPRKDIQAIAELAFAVKKDVITSATINKLRDLINLATLTDTVVLALTELSILFASQRDKSRSRKRFIDTLEVLADRIAEIYIAERLASGAR